MDITGKTLDEIDCETFDVASNASVEGHETFRKHVYEQVFAAFSAFANKMDDTDTKYDPDPDIADAIDRHNYVARYLLVQYRRQVEKYKGPRWSNLGAIVHLPVELLALIFQMLHPIDLYLLIQTTRFIRALLLSREASPIWEKSFLNNPDIPFYPEDVSAPMWASLLFGPATCDGCNCKNVVIDVTYRGRKCSNCADMIHSHADDFYKLLLPMSDKHHSIRSDIRNLVRKTDTCAPLYLNLPRNAGIVDVSDFGPNYSRNDLVQKAQEMALLLDDVVSGIPGAPEAYAKFVDDTARAVQVYLSHAETCKQWGRKIMQECVAEFNESVTRAFEPLTKTLEGSGHDRRDIEAATSASKEGFQRDWGTYRCRKLDERVALRELPMYHAWTHNKKNQRLINEHEGRVKLRQDRLTEFYLRIAKDRLRPDTSPYLPNPAIVHKLPIFRNYLEDPAVTVSDVPDDPELVEEIPRFVDSVIKHKKDHLANILLQAGISHPSNGAAGNDLSAILDLATAVFECTGAKHRHVFIGWGEAGIHVPCRSAKMPEESPLTSNGYESIVLDFHFQFSERGQTVLKMIAELVGLDWRTARAKDLDARNARFICKTCYFQRKGKAYGLYTMDWRHALQHTFYVIEGEEICRTPGLIVLSDELAKSVYFVEQPHPSPADKSWSCKHCSEHFLVRVKKAQAIKHVNTSHHIRAPVVGTDIYYHQLDRSPMPPGVFVGLGDDSNHRCLRCPERRNLRLWLKEDLFKHLEDKHENDAENDFVEGIDWIKIKPMEDGTWIPAAMRAQGLI